MRLVDPLLFEVIILQVARSRVAIDISNPAKTAKYLAQLTRSRVAAHK